MNDETILVITGETTDPANVQRGYRDEGRICETRLAVSQLERNMSAFLHSIRQVFHETELEAENSSSIRLDEIELAVEVSGEGEIKLLGTGGKASAKSAITLTFKRTA